MHYLAQRHPDIQAADSNSIVSVDHTFNHDPVTGIFLLTSKTQILTVHETAMKKWDLATGNMIKLIRLLPSQLNKSHTISCCSVSDTKKLLLLGTSHGLVAVISIYSGGLVMKCQPKHNHNVVFTGIYKKMIVSVDSHGTIHHYNAFKNSFYSANHVSNDILLRSKLVQLPTVRIEDEQRKTISLCGMARVHKKYGILIVASDSGLMRFVCLTNDKVILEVHSLEDEVTAMVLEEEKCHLFTADKSGNICCWEMPQQYPARRLFFCTALWRVQNMDSQNQPLSTFCMQTLGDFVITGDAKGQVKVWQMKKVKEVQGHQGIMQQRAVRGSISANMDEMRLFQLTELGLDDWECKLMMTFPASKDWLHHLLVVTDKDLNRARRDGADIEDEESSDEQCNEKSEGVGRVLCLITSSLDGQLFAWKLTGSCLGELNANSSRNKKVWKVRVDLEEMESSRLKHAAKLFNQFEL